MSCHAYIFFRKIHAWIRIYRRNRKGLTRVPSLFGDVDFADLKPSILNALVVTLTVVVMLNLLKFAMAKWPVPGLAPLIQNT